MVQSKVPCHS